MNYASKSPIPVGRYAGDGAFDECLQRCESLYSAADFREIIGGCLARGRGPESVVAILLNQGGIAASEGVDASEAVCHVLALWNVTVNGLVGSDLS